MTREEQIIKASQFYAKTLQKPFMDGAMWADAHPDLYSVTRKAVEREREYLINKACEWLNRNFNMPNNFESHFKKAMEKQQ